VIQQQQVKVRPLSVTTNIPLDGGTAQVVPQQNQQGYICARGSASRPASGSPDPVQVYAKIYAGHLGPNDVPTTPPADATQVTPVRTSWSFSSIPGAAYAAADPYPWSTLVVWAQFQDSTNPYDRTLTQFQGLQATTTDCGT
jgi:hypothetical protein